MRVDRCGLWFGQVRGGSSGGLSADRDTDLRIEHGIYFLPEIGDEALVAFSVIAATYFSLAQTQ